MAFPAVNERDYHSRVEHLMNDYIVTGNVINGRILYSLRRTQRFDHRADFILSQQPIEAIAEFFFYTIALTDRLNVIEVIDNISKSGIAANMLERFCHCSLNYAIAIHLIAVSSCKRYLLKDRRFLGKFFLFHKAPLDLVFTFHTRRDIPCRRYYVDHTTVRVLQW